MSNRKYSILHCHTMLSSGTTNIDSITRYQDYINQAKKDDLYNICFTEHGNIYEWYHKKEAVETAGYKYIHGVEAYITEDNESNNVIYSAANLLNSAITNKDCSITFKNYWQREDGMWLAENLDDNKVYPIDISTLKKEKTVKTRDNYHCILLARNYDGFKELNRLISSSYNRAIVKCFGEKDQFYYTPRILFDDLLNTSSNIIILTACMAGILSKGNDVIKDKFLEFLSKNSDRCFLEVQHHNCKEQADYNKYLEELSKQYNIRLVACTDTHCLNDSHKKGRSILQKSKKVYFDNEEDWDLVYKNYDELVNAFEKQKALSKEDYMAAIENTNVIVDMIEEFSLDKNTKYPKLYDDSIGEYKKKINNAYKNHKYLKERYPKKKLKEVFNNELEVYEKTKSIDFMLLQTYMREWEKKNGIKCGYSRGSVSGSEIAYALGITEMDSLKFGLNFFRFMNPSRVTNADIDTDYGSKDREKVKYFLLHDHMELPQIQSSEIITFNTIAMKGAIKDVCRALNIANDEAQKISDAVFLDENKKWTIPDEWKEQYPEVFEYVDILVGTVVSVGTHPSGVLISDRNLYEEIGLCSLSTSDYPVSMLNMKELDSLMYVKLDILGLDNIGIINDTCEMLGIERLNPDNTNLEDEKVWKDIRDDTTMIFQWESDSAQAYLKKFMSDETIKKAKKINKDFSYVKWVSFGNGLIRPGCASFRDDVADGNNIITGFKELDDFLAITFGRIVMQEDIMQFLVKFCGYSDAESDNVRRGVAKKVGTEKFIDEIHDRFIEYSHKTYGIDVDRLEEIFPPIKQGILDATYYAFSWNHSDAYTCIGYICGYLRYYHPLEFITAALNTFVDKEEKTLAITEYAKKRNISIESIKFRYSSADYSCDSKNNKIYKGLESIKYLNAKMANELYELKNNKYNSFIDLLYDIKKTSTDSRQLDILIKLDYFSEFGEINKLLKITEIFETLHDKSQFKKDKLSEFNLTEEIVRKHSGSETETRVDEIDCKAYLNNHGISEDPDCMKYKYIKDEFGKTKEKVPNGYSTKKTIKKYQISNEEQEKYATKVVIGRFSEIDMNGLLSDIFDSLEVPKCSISDKLKYQKEHLGYINMKLRVPECYYYITNIDGKYSNKVVTLYQLKTGTTVTMKVKGKTLEQYPLNEGDMINIVESKEEQKWGRKDGEYYKKDEYETVLKKYNYVR